MLLFFCLICETILHPLIDHVVWRIRWSLKSVQITHLIPEYFQSVMIVPALFASQGVVKDK